MKTDDFAVPCSQLCIISLNFTGTECSEVGWGPRSGVGYIQSVLSFPRKDATSFGNACKTQTFPRPHYLNVCTVRTHAREPLGTSLGNNHGILEDCS